VRSRNIKLITVVAVVIILAAQALVLILIYSPDYFAGVVLNLMLRPERIVEKLPGEEASGQGASGMQKDGAASPGQDAPAKLNAAEITANTFSTALQEQKSSLDTNSYNRYSQITSKYKSDLISLQEEFDVKLSQLISSARRDYQQDDQKNSASVLKLTERYISAGKALEADCDSRFYNKLAAMEMELKANNLPTGVVEQTKNSYIILKNERRRQLIDKAMTNLRN